MMIERRKQPEKPVPHPDTVAAPLDREGMQQKLIGTIDAKVKSGAISQQNRIAVSAYLLGALRDGDRPLANEVEVMTLLRCSPREMKEARRVAGEALTMGNALGRAIREIELDMTNPSAVAQQKAEERGTVEQQLLRFARSSFVSNPSPTSNARKSEEKLARFAIALIARRVLKKEPGESAELAGVNSVDVLRDILVQAQQEYAARGSFHRKVRAICEEIGVAAP